MILYRTIAPIPTKLCEIKKKSLAPLAQLILNFAQGILGLVRFKFIQLKDLAGEGGGG